MGMKKWFKEWSVKRERGKVAKKIESGELPRGRTTDMLSATPSGSVGNAVLSATTELIAIHRRINPATGRYEEIGRRKVLDKMITTAFVNYVVDNLIAELAAFGDFKFHDSGTGTGAEAITDEQLGNDCGEARDTGTQVEVNPNQYRSVATHTYAGTFAITEHGLFNIATLAAGILMDRTLFAAINVIASDQIQFTYTVTFTAGG